ncbi:Cytochrome c subfamily, putative [Coleofasciculus chthonoplastes PCC 7420]|uniref:Cytochrome c subfamily, putative n=1 Tax=Coleofasciculus chthonoplastes PCC 7420 TaxID=118168 RepID=B4W441_9CYAN|nr:Cytochrome c subfamily, putative [Coleofasciculus chthonoplastes PCC 7420]
MAGDPLENQLDQPQVLVRRIIMVVLALLFVIGIGIFGFQVLQVSDPYIQKVLSLNGDPVRGQAIFEINCADCHGMHADGKVGPSLQHISKHRSPSGLIEQVISGQTPPMPKFQPSPQEMADLLTYLEKL